MSEPGKKMKKSVLNKVLKSSKIIIIEYNDDAVKYLESQKKRFYILNNYFIPSHDSLDLEIQ